jgi:Ca2+-binding RTX toxin-like protein
MATQTINNGVVNPSFPDTLPTVDLQNATLTNIDTIEFDTTIDTLALFDFADVGVGILSNATLVGDENFNIVAFRGAGVMDFSGTSFVLDSSWDADVDILALFGTSGADEITGSDLGEYINGEFDYENDGGSNDILNGGGGSDVLEGWSGRDEVHGDAGDDFLVPLKVTLSLAKCSMAAKASTHCSSPLAEPVI